MVFECSLETGVVWEKLFISLVILVEVGYVFRHELLDVASDFRRGGLLEPICWGVIGSCVRGGIGGIIILGECIDW